MAGGIRSDGILYLGAVGIPSAVLLVLLWQGGFCPFGARTLFIMDMKDQYLEFYAYLRNLFSGDNSLFYCWSRSMGGNFLGLFAYYLASPLSFLTCLFPLERMDEAITLLTVAKIGLCGLSFAIYGNYLWKRASGGKSAPVPVMWLFCACYALISYNMMYSLCLMWLDGVILLPLVLLGVEKLTEGGLGLNYTLALATVFVSNYYIGYMVGIFSGLYFLYRLVCGSAGRSLKAAGKCIVRFFVCTCLALGISAPLLLPAVRDLLQGKLSGGSGYTLSFEANFSLAEFFGKFRNGAYDSVTDSGLPSVYCGVTVLVLAVVFFYCMSITLREKAGALLLLVILGASFYYKGINLAWHGFRPPIWFPYRYGFLFSFVLIYMAFRACCALCTGWAGKRIGEKRRRVWAAYLFLGGVSVINLLDLGSNGQAILDGLNSQFPYAEAAEYDGFIEKTKPLTDWVKERDGGLYRVNITYEYSKNDAMLLGINGMTHYSSTYNTAVNNLTRSLGMAQSHIWNSGYGSNPLLDSLFAVAYRISDRREPAYYDMLLDGGKGAAVYGNSLALPMVYAADAGDMDPLFSGNADPCINQNIFLNAIAGKNEQYFRELTWEKREDETGWIYTANALTGNPLYLYLDSWGYGWADVYVNDVWYGNYFSTETTCSLYIGSYEPGEQVTIRVNRAWGDVGINGAVIAELDMSVLEPVLRELQEGGMEITEHSGGKIKGKVSVAEGQKVMTSVPYDNGWQVWVDGRIAETERFAGTFLAVDVPAGEHELRFVYVSPGFYPGLCLFVPAAAVSGIYFGRRSWKGRRSGAISR